MTGSAGVSSERPFYALHADAYDLLIIDPVGPWVDAVHGRLRRPGASILDAGCGTGRHAAALVARGYRVDLVDASAELLALAAKRCPSARTFLADLCEMRTSAGYDAVTCRGVLNDMITDEERVSAVKSLVGSLKPGGVLFLDVREARASRERADGVPRSRQVAGLTFTSRTTWSDGLLHVEEQYEADRRSTYHFTMRPWTEEELRAVLPDAEISSGVGRRTADRLFVTARR